MSSKMPQIYIHYFGNESSKSLLEAYGIEDNSKKGETNVLKSKPCPNCNEPNKPDSRFCFRCKMVLTFDSYQETLEKQIEQEKKIESLTEQVKNIDVLIGQRFSEFFSKYGLVDYNNLKNNNEIKKQK
jgi:hypothetical protein